MSRRIIMRDVTDKHNPKVVSEMVVDNDDVIPQIGDKVSHSITKKGFQDSTMHCSRRFDVVQREFTIDKGTNNVAFPNGEILSVWYELVNDGSEPTS